MVLWSNVRQRLCHSRGVNSSWSRNDLAFRHWLKAVMNEVSKSVFRLHKLKASRSFSNLVDEPRLVRLDVLIMELYVEIDFLFIVKSPEDLHCPKWHEECIFNFGAEKSEANRVILFKRLGHSKLNVKTFYKIYGYSELEFAVCCLSSRVGGHQGRGDLNHFVSGAISLRRENIHLLTESPPGENHQENEFKNHLHRHNVLFDCKTVKERNWQ